MDTIELVDGKINCSIDELEKIIRENCYRGVYIVGFIDKEEAESFVGKFPKYVRLKVGTIYSYEYNFASIPCVSFYIDTKNSRTGEFNEAGEKRIKALVRKLSDFYY